MDSKDKVYLVCYGAYADYFIECAFLNEESAQKYADKLNGHKNIGDDWDHYYVEEYQLLK